MKRECFVHKDGVCAMHDIEIERRKNSDEKIKFIPSMLTKINVMAGYSILATIFIIGCFAYSKENKAELQADISILTKQVLDLTMIASRNETKYEMVLKYIEAVAKEGG